MLELRQAYAGEELCCDPSGFSKLKRLGLHELERLQRIRIAKGSMPGLERLDITACTVLETVPDGIENLKNIEDLVLWHMPSTFIKTIERYRGEDFWRVQHITTITRIYESQGRWVSETPVIRGVNYGEDCSFWKIMISAKFLRSVQTFHHVMLSLRKSKTAALPSSSLLLCLCSAVVESSNLLSCPCLSPLNFGHRQFLDINTSIFGICQMFILFFYQISQLEIVLQVHINFFYSGFVLFVL
jgi:hypothetical protein